jgi:hypothetical protein
LIKAHAFATVALRSNHTGSAWTAAAFITLEVEVRGIISVVVELLYTMWIIGRIRMTLKDLAYISASKTFEPPQSPHQSP